MSTSGGIGLPVCRFIENLGFRLNHAEGFLGFAGMLRLDGLGNLCDGDLSLRPDGILCELRHGELEGARVRCRCERAEDQPEIRVPASIREHLAIAGHELVVRAGVFLSRKAHHAAQGQPAKRFIGALAVDARKEIPGSHVRPIRERADRRVPHLGVRIALRIQCQCPR